MNDQFIIVVFVLCFLSLPMVGRCEVANLSSQKRSRRFVLPTPESPIIKSLKIQSYSVSFCFCIIFTGRRYSLKVDIIGAFENMRKEKITVMCLFLFKRFFDLLMKTNNLYAYICAVY